MRKSAKKGFTLIELIIVIAILGILAAVLIPKIAGVKTKSQVGVNRTNSRQVQSALAQYYADNDKYPTTLTDAENAVKDSIGHIPFYKDGTTHMFTAYTTNAADGFVLTYADDLGTDGVTESTQGTVHVLTSGTDTNRLWK